VAKATGKVAPSAKPIPAGSFTAQLTQTVTVVAKVPGPNTAMGSSGTKPETPAPAAVAATVYSMPMAGPIGPCFSTSGNGAHHQQDVLAVQPAGAHRDLHLPSIRRTGVNAVPRHRL